MDNNCLDYNHALPGSPETWADEAEALSDLAYAEEMAEINHLDNDCNEEDCPICETEGDSDD